MIFTTFMRTAVRLSKNLATMLSLPPVIWMPKPKKTAAMISGRIALRLHSSPKSGLVKKFMIMSVTLSVELTSPSTMV